MEVGLLLKAKKKFTLRMIYRLDCLIALIQVLYQNRHLGPLTKTTLWEEIEKTSVETHTHTIAKYTLV